MREDLYCKVYINSEKSKDELIQFIATLVDGKVSLRTIAVSFMEIDVFYNDAYDEQLLKSDYDGFLYYAYYLDIEARDDVQVDSGEYKRLLRKLLHAMTAQGDSVVPACDYEDELN